jgi:hypothetical protein
MNLIFFTTPNTGEICPAQREQLQQGALFLVDFYPDEERAFWAGRRKGQIEIQITGKKFFSNTLLTYPNIFFRKF